MRLKYKVKFFDYWHLSSGLSGGAALDSYVVKDENNLPYIPAKTLKGLTREMAEVVADCEFVNRCFGGSSDDKDRCFNEKAKNKAGSLYFKNATLDEKETKEIISNNLQDNLYDIIASTKIDKNGIAQDNSLREIEVVIPLTLQGEILDLQEEDKDHLILALQMIKRMGLNRNRGLGRCEFFDFDVVEDR